MSQPDHSGANRPADSGTAANESSVVPTAQAQRQRPEGIPLGRIAGIPLILAYSWFLIAAFIVLVFGPLIRSNFPALGAGAFGIAFIYALLLLFSVLVHELAHALMARLFGWPTEKIVLTLWGGHTQFADFKATPWRSLVVALSGPVANLFLAAVGWLLLLVLPDDSSTSSVLLAALTNIFIWANLLIGLFNVLPGLPLDGGRLVESIVWRITGSQERGTVAAGWAGRVVVVLMVIIFLVIPLVLHGPSYNLQTALLTLLVAGFLWIGASQAIKTAQMRLRLPAISAGKLCEPAVGVAAESSVAHVLNMVSSRPDTAVVLCARDGRPAYLVDPLALTTVPISSAAATPATAVAKPLPAGGYVRETASGQPLVQYLAQLGGHEYAVLTDRGQVTGLLRQQVVVAAITGKSVPRSD